MKGNCGCLWNSLGCKTSLNDQIKKSMQTDKWQAREADDCVFVIRSLTYFDDEENCRWGVKSTVIKSNDSWTMSVTKVSHLER